MSEHYPQVSVMGAEEKVTFTRSIYIDTTPNIPTKLQDELDGSFEFTLEDVIERGTRINIGTPYFSKLYIEAYHTRDTENGLSKAFLEQGWKKEAGDAGVKFREGSLDNMTVSIYTVVVGQYNSTKTIEVPDDDLRLAIFVKEGKY